MELLVTLVTLVTLLRGRERERSSRRPNMIGKGVDQRSRKKGRGEWAEPEHRRGGDPRQGSNVGPRGDPSADEGRAGRAEWGGVVTWSDTPPRRKRASRGARAARGGVSARPPRINVAMRGGARRAPPEERGPQLRNYVTTLLRYYVTTLLRYYVTTLLRYYVTTLLRYFTKQWGLRGDLAEIPRQGEKS
jgi:hypothetical protein